MAEIEKHECKCKSAMKMMIKLHGYQIARHFSDDITDQTPARSVLLSKNRNSSFSSSRAERMHEKKLQEIFREIKFRLGIEAFIIVTEPA